MSEANGGTEYTTGNPLVDAAFKRLQAKNDARFRDIEDAMVVQAHLEKGMSERLKQHAEFLARQGEFIERHEQSMREFDDKLNGVIGSLEQFRQSLVQLGKRDQA
jgi:hypothetical protein